MEEDRASRSVGRNRANKKERERKKERRRRRKRGDERDEEARKNYWDERDGTTGRESRGRRRERKEAGSAANDESNKTRTDGRFGQIGRPFNWEFDEFMDFLICHYGRPFTNSPSSLATPLSLILPVPVEGAKMGEKKALDTWAIVIVFSPGFRIPEDAFSLK